MVQEALTYQTRKCKKLVIKYTKKLQEKEHQYQAERNLRDDQLSHVLRTLLVFEAKLKQEQKFIYQQLQEKDFIIKKQKHDINYLLKNQVCKQCNESYNSVSNLGSFNSSLECIGIECPEFPNSNLESLESNGIISDVISNNEIKTKLFEENLEKNESSSKSLEENYKNVTENIVSNNLTVTIDSDNKILDNSKNEGEDKILCNFESSQKLCNNSNISEKIVQFEENGDNNDKWYASTSDPEDDELRNLYRNNPVLECMNQILQQNINSPPKTPSIERKVINNKKVKFIDDNKGQPNSIENEITNNTQKMKNIDIESNYYETPIQKIQNFYETPQSIYSNDYEQILSNYGQSTECAKQQNPSLVKMYENNNKADIKYKLQHSPPALPPKPTNLLPKCKINNLEQKIQYLPASSIESEPDYCSISEINLPDQNADLLKKIEVVAEENASKLSATERQVIIHKPKALEISYTSSGKNLLNEPVLKINENNRIQNSNQNYFNSFTSIKQNLMSPNFSSSKNTSDIPKLPQVAEIIIPDEVESKTTTDLITSDNYIKNNSQLNVNPTKIDYCRKPVIMGKSVSSIINSFNNQQLLAEMQQKFEKPKVQKKEFVSAKNNLKHNSDSMESSNKVFDSFDFKQNFEEFKLDECDVMEEYNFDLPDLLSIEKIQKDEIVSSPIKERNNFDKTTNKSPKKLNTFSQLNSDHFINPTMSRDKNTIIDEKIKFYSSEPSYEYFLECTGLSSKPLLIPSRVTTNHKNVLKPKDVKLRSKARSSMLDKSNNAVKYWSEPFV